jgi:hypothetical protein
MRNRKSLFDELGMPSLQVSNQDLSGLSLTPKRAIKTVVALWLVWVFVCLAGAVGIIAIAWHFIAKFW